MKNVIYRFCMISLVLIAVAALTLPSAAQIVQSGSFIIDLSQVEKAPTLKPQAGTDTEMLVNNGFETGDFPPWYHDGSWTISTVTPHTGSYCAYDIGNHWLRQDITPIAGSDIASATVWCMQPEEAIAAIDFYYTDGSYDEDLIWPMSFWQSYDVTSFIDPTKTVNGFRVWGYSGGGPDPDETFYDDLSIDGITGTPNMNITLTYVSGSPVPSTGGNVYYELFVENAGTTALDFDAWLDLAYEGGVPTTVAQRSFTNYLPGWTINRPNMFFPVPGSYAAGNYVFTGRIGEYPAIEWDTSGFPFVKSGTDHVAGFVPFPVDGAPNPFDEIMTGEMNATPSEFALYGVYPNPFNPTTAISFQLSAFSHVNLSVYDIGGREVVRLVNGMRDAGVHEISFDASHLASGIYIYRLTAGDFNATGKMVLMK